TLLGNFEDIKKVGHPQSWMAIDEVQNTMMRPAEAELSQHRIGLAGKVAIGEEEQLDGSNEILPLNGLLEISCGLSMAWSGRAYTRGCIYVSHVDLFGGHCYRWQVPLCTVDRGLCDCRPHRSNKSRSDGMASRIRSLLLAWHRHRGRQR